MRIGVFVCHCGTNIAGTVDVARVRDEIAKVKGVVYAIDLKYTCSEPGQAVIKKAIQEYNLDRIVVAACSPRMHEPTFSKLIQDVGLNPYMLDMANIREQCSWVHSDKEAATQKAIQLVKSSVAKARYLVPLVADKVSIEKQALVIGGGIAGIQAALDIANAGFKVTIVEREPSIGGRMAQLEKTFPTLDCSA